MPKTIQELTGITLDTLCADVKMEPTYIGRRTNDDKWEHDSWSVSLTFKGHTYQDIAYRMGIGNSPQPPKIVTIHDQEVVERFYTRPPAGTWNPTPPTAADIISSLMMDVSGLDQGFEDWASNYGMDADSRKAEAMYKRCLETLPRLHALLGDDFGRFETAAQDY